MLPVFFLTFWHQPCFSLFQESKLWGWWVEQQTFRKIYTSHVASFTIAASLWLSCVQWTYVHASEYAVLSRTFTRDISEGHWNLDYSWGLPPRSSPRSYCSHTVWHTAPAFSPKFKVPLLFWRIRFCPTFAELVNFVSLYNKLKVWNCCHTLCMQGVY